METEKPCELINSIKEDLDSLNSRVASLENLNADISAISELAAKIENLETKLMSIKNLLALIAESKPVIYKFPVNTDGWIKKCDNFNILDLNGKIYSLFASSAYEREDLLPYNILTKVEGKDGGWHTAANKSGISWITFCYPEAVQCNCMRIKARPAHKDQAPKKFEIRASNEKHFLDGHYVLLKSCENVDYTPNLVKKIDFENTRKFLYYQVYVYETRTNVTGISELNFGLKITPEFIENF